MTLHFELLLQTRVTVCSDFFGRGASFEIRPGRVLSVNQEIAQLSKNGRNGFFQNGSLPEITDLMLASHHDMIN